MISIAMAAYNGEKYIREQLDSILAQTIQDFELVICDDCSTDSTLSILREYEAKDSRIHVFANEKNLGFKKNFERAVSLCSGDYIALSDQDDIWYPNHLEVLYNSLTTGGGGCSLVCADADIIDADGNLTGKRRTDFDIVGDYMDENPEKAIFLVLLFQNPFQGSAMLMFTSFAKSILPIPEGIDYHDSFISASALMDGGLKWVKKSVMRYRQHGNNITSDRHPSSKTVNHKKLLRLLSFPFRAFKRIFIDHGIVSDRFAFVDCLSDRYGLSNPDFACIAEFFAHIRRRCLAPSDIRFIWRNYHWISGRKGHKGFIKRIIAYSLWHPVA